MIATETPWIYSRTARGGSKEDVFAIFAAAPALDVAELCADLDVAVDQGLRDHAEINFGRDSGHRDSLV